MKFYFRNLSYKRLFGKELVREDLSEFVFTPVFEAFLRKQKANENLNDEEICEIQDNLVKDIDTFRNFTTYFSGFYENRKNLYTSDDKATSIAHRIIGENLPKFVDNMGVFAKIEDSEISTHFGELFKAMEPWLNVLAINEMFKLDYFQMVLTQKQIDVYNSIIGGRTLEDGSKIRGLNEYINLYNQKQKDKGSRLPKLKPLFKQILSERNAISWLPDEFESDNHMLESIKICYQDLNNHVFESLKGLLKSLDTYDLEHIYLPNDLQLTEISQKYYGSWSLIKSVALDSLKAIYSQKRNENVDEYEKRLNKLYDSFSIADINNLLKNKIEVFEPVEGYFAQMGAEDDENGQKPNLFIRIETAHNEVASLLRSPYPEGKSLSQDKVSVEKIKKLLDAIKDLQHFVKPLLGKGTESEKDNNFYGEFVPLWEMLDKITPLYNMVRNRMLRKPDSDEKIKLYFENNGSFLNGWVDSKTDSDNATQYGGYLFRKRNSIGEYDYYLGVSAATKLFRSFNPVEDVDKSSFERLDYYQLKGKTFYGALYKGDYEVESLQIKRAIDSVVSHSSDSELKEKINAERTKKQSKIATAIGYLKFIRQQKPVVYNLILNDNAFEKSNQVLMNSIKTTLLSLDRIPSAKEYAQRNYSLFSEMMDDIDVLLQGKIFSYFPVSQNELEEAVNRTLKPLYLFKITNKDLSFAETNEKGLRKSRGIDNLHTMYFKALMSGCQDVFDIGSGSVFFRERKIDYSKEQLKKGHHYEMLKEKFNYPIISKKRYAFDKFQFHLSITMNYNADMMSIHSEKE